MSNNLDTDMHQIGAADIGSTEFISTYRVIQHGIKIDNAILGSMSLKNKKRG
jgi:hypothetical protein